MNDPSMGETPRTDIPELVKRLRRRAENRRRSALTKQADELDEAAAALSEQQERIAELERALQDAVTLYQRYAALSDIGAKPCCKGLAPITECECERAKRGAP